jgi:amidase
VQLTAPTSPHRGRRCAASGNAVRLLNPRALQDAALLDLERATGHVRPLHGVPVLVKDNLDAAGLPTTAGSVALRARSWTATRPWSRLRAAGAVISARRT